MLEELLRQLMGGAPLGTTLGAPRDEGEPDEVRLLRIQFHDAAGQPVMTPATPVEIRRKRAFGFNPRERREARLDLPADACLLPAVGISLMEDNQPYGPEHGWKCRWAEVEGQGIRYWLEEA